MVKGMVICDEAIGNINQYGQSLRIDGRVMFASAAGTNSSDIIGWPESMMIVSLRIFEQGAVPFMSRTKGKEGIMGMNDKTIMVTGTHDSVSHTSPGFGSATQMSSRPEAQGPPESVQNFTGNIYKSLYIVL